MEEESSFVSRWRPAFAWVYMIVILFDYIIAPTYSMYIGALEPWVSLTSGSGGVFHLAMGAILGASAWTRGMEKMKRIEYSGYYQSSMEEEHPEIY